MKLSYLLLIIVLFSFLPHSADAEIYKWKDENGKIHFSDTPPENQKSETREYVDSYGSEPDTKHAVKKDIENSASRKGFNNSAGTRKKKTRTEKYLESYDRDLKRKAPVKSTSRKRSMLDYGAGQKTSKVNKECISLIKQVKKLEKRRRKAHDNPTINAFDQRIKVLKTKHQQKCWY